MKTKTLLELRENDLMVLNYLTTDATIKNISLLMFPYAKNPGPSLNKYLVKLLGLGLIDKVSRGKYKVNKTGVYFINFLEDIQNRNI